jgi:biopolymer transport protein ExbD
MNVLAGSRALRELNGDREWELPTAMIDIVFLLLIFFMCVSKFRVVERRLDARMPHGIRERTTKKLEEGISLAVSGTGEALRAPLFEIAGWRTSDPNELARHLRRMAAVCRLSVVIDGRPNCPFRHVMTDFDCCARADLKVVEFKAPPGSVEGGAAQVPGRS